jgi:ATPase subunit of ABC transporter with duplicated ATPase domains
MAISLNHLTKKVGARLLFEEITVSFNAGNRYGLTGPNGSGKSTLLKIIMGLEEPTSGTVSLPERVGYLRQNIEDFKDMKVLDVVIMGNKRLWQTLQNRENLYAQEMTDEIGIQLAELEEVIAQEDGYSAETQAGVLLEGMGIVPAVHEFKMETLPIDRQFRVLLCQALFGEPQALLLDEPTNHLDLESIRWLENFLHRYKGVLVVVSHDRHFLNAVTTHIADLDYDTLIIYPGNYDQMLVAKTAVRERTEEENKTKEKKIAQLKDFVARFGAGTRASQVQSRVREIQRLQPQELKKSNIQRPYIRFALPEKSAGERVFALEKVKKSFGKQSVIHSLSLEVRQGDKIGVIGNNGRGKTTLLKMLKQLLPHDQGRIEVSPQAIIGYFPQNHEEIIDKREKISAFEWLKNKKGGIYDQEIRGALGKMLFSGDDAFKLISHLSGGETARLILASMMLSPYNVLVLDEPNNHLDLEAVSALSWGLQDYKGVVLLATHDRDLLGDVCNKILSLEEGKEVLFHGSLEEYLATHK